ncbi:FkbM family methyltransferase [Sedimenticola thiotaurini]|uniref:Methyltransferase FkbM domain-containing protein n=1 Tax=Sedimenticola thiotaurini TaxID=1543721 RepID=A0A0F7JYP4_9GAMM|nr:FkbM family methyltransferase [Sedimenticola thiotaurini]AKH20847.1 hypothetical protein AAY24_11360 [Sedimenticola thiotaurini]
MRRQLVQIIPEWIKKPVRAWRERKIIDEIRQLPVKGSGVEGELPYVELDTGMVFYGTPPTDMQRYYFRYLKDDLPELSEDCMNVVWEIVDRYLVPRSVPGETIYNPVLTKLLRDPLNDFTYSFERRKELAAMFRPQNGEVCIDIGAYHGYGTMRLAQLVGDEGKVIAFEADSDSAAILSKNIEANRFRNIRVINHAVSDHKGKETIYRLGTTANSLNHDVLSNVCDAMPHTEEIDVNTVDNILGGQGIHHCNHVSITINGAEPEALVGMRDLLTRSTNVRISIAGWYPREDAKVADFVIPHLEEMGFKVIRGDLGRVLAWK